MYGWWSRAAMVGAVSRVAVDGRESDQTACTVCTVLPYRTVSTGFTILYYTIPIWREHAAIQTERVLAIMGIGRYRDRTEQNRAAATATVTATVTKMVIS